MSHDIVFYEDPQPLVWVLVENRSLRIRVMAHRLPSLPEEHQFVVRMDGQILNKATLEFEHEGLPSSRDEDWFRFYGVSSPEEAGRLAWLAVNRMKSDESDSRFL